jgi:hypothetical protein
MSKIQITTGFFDGSRFVKSTLGDAYFDTLDGWLDMLRHHDSAEAQTGYTEEELREILSERGELKFQGRGSDYAFLVEVL